MPAAPPAPLVEAITFRRDEWRQLRHELLTPLNAIIGYSELLLEDTTAPQRADAGSEIAKIRAAGVKLQGLIDELFRRQPIPPTSKPAPASSLLAASEAQPAPTSATPGQARPVLVVDDNPDNRDLLARQLARQGHQVLTAANGQQALELLRAQACDLVLLDLMMPELDGFQTLEQIKNDPALRDIPVIMISAVDEMESVVRCITLGATDYLPKPFNPVLLRARVGACLAQKRLRDGELEYHRLLATVNRQLARANEDLLAILDQLQLGVALTDHLGRVTFLSQRAAELFNQAPEAALGQAWQQIFPLSPADQDRLRKLAVLPAAQRQKLTVTLPAIAGRQSHLEIEAQDDPRHQQGRLFFFYDVTEAHDLRRLLDEKQQFPGLIGQSQPMQILYRRIREIAPVETTVLITGETGTGKELAAGALHHFSPRRARPFIPVNCAGLTEALLGSQLFGHRRGAFTGAVTDQIGLFEAAHGGTIFLDEIGEMPLGVQTQLLRVLQEKEITRLGETKPRKIDARIIAATNRDLLQCVQAGSFRPDLFYRIRVATLQLPSLRERREDIPLLVAWFLGQLRVTIGKTVEDVSREALYWLLCHSWPGNVRELRAVLEAAVIHCAKTTLSAADLRAAGLLPALLPEEAGAVPASEETLSEKERLLAALKRAKGNRTLAARLLGISRATLYRRLTELKINAD